MRGLSKIQGGQKVLLVVKNSENFVPGGDRKTKLEKFFFQFWMSKASDRLNRCPKNHTESLDIDNQTYI